MRRMSTKQNLTRRQFIATTGAALVASQLPAAESDLDKPALKGGKKMVKRPPPKRVRWGEPERAQLDSALARDTLLNWKAPQTTLLAKRFSDYTGLKHVMPCSSGTAALHIAVATSRHRPGRRSHHHAIYENSRAMLAGRLFAKTENVRLLLPLPSDGRGTGRGHCRE